MVGTVEYGISPRKQLVDKAVAELGVELAEVVTVRVLWRAKVFGPQDFEMDSAKIRAVEWFVSEFGNAGPDVCSFVKSVVAEGATVETFDRWWDMVVYDDVVEVEARW